MLMCSAFCLISWAYNTRITKTGGLRNEYKMNGVSQNWRGSPCSSRVDSPTLTSYFFPLTAPRHLPYSSSNLSA